MIKAIITDIEGTTSSISFVKEVLFPYAAKHLPEFVRAHQEDAAVREQLARLWSDWPELDQDIEASIQRLLDWIAQDEKQTVLKSLQGMIWKHGYESGAYRAHVYADAAEYLRRWHAEGMDLYVYSSGSIAAQKLFFTFSEAGNITPLFSGYFDTTTGPKQAPESYARIIRAIGLPAEQLLFLSDIEAELDAAKSMGMHTCHLVRPQDTPAETLSESGKHTRARSFADIAAVN